MYANVQKEVCKCARRHAANYSCPSPCFTNVTISREKKNISADEGGAASALLLGFLARFVSTKTLNIHRPSSDLRWLPCQQIASHFGALGVEGEGRGRCAKNSFSVPHA